MGRERTGAGKHVCLYLAGLSFFSLIGCAALDTGEKREVREHLIGGQRFLAKGDYEGALQENQKTLSLAAHGPYGDQALFNLGLIYAHYGNPKKDYGKSIAFFQKLVKEYPESPLIEQAKIWVGVLEANDLLHQVNDKLNEVIKKSKQVDIEIEKKKREKEK